MPDFSCAVLPALIDNAGGLPLTCFLSSLVSFQGAWVDPQNESNICNDTNDNLVAVASRPQLY
jgi:hypothetical protein